jgi:hypothetical protein
MWRTGPRRGSEMRLRGARRASSSPKRPYEIHTLRSGGDYLSPLAGRGRRTPARRVRGPRRKSERQERSLRDSDSRNRPLTPTLSPHAGRGSRAAASSIRADVEYSRKPPDHTSVPAGARPVERRRADPGLNPRISLHFPVAIRGSRSAPIVRAFRMPAPTTGRSGRHPPKASQTAPLPVLLHPIRRNILAPVSKLVD